MDRLKDREDGPDFWRWIEEHQRSDEGNPLFDTFFLLEKATGRVVATGSIVADDRGVGKTYRIEGAWIGGINVRGEYRGRNLGRVLLSVLHRHVQEIADRSGAEVIVNLFTSPDLGRSFYEPEYQRFRTVVTSFGESVCYRRVFRPGRREGAGHHDG
ncbi:MAG: GNAT family N-acetyltransferase [Isosphaeraceae bacterium]|nr:GNAT family N-acetyltransferase [Isosphaeraceae bacterium]